MFDQRAMEVLRYARNLNAPLVWNEPSVGGFGYRDAWNEGDGGWSASQHLSIDDGALLVAIENARTGRVWSLFHDHPFVQLAMDRIGLTRSSCAGRMSRGCGSQLCDRILGPLGRFVELGLQPGNPADVNQDNAVEFSDLLAVLSAIGPPLPVNCPNNPTSPQFWFGTAASRRTMVRSEWKSKDEMIAPLLACTALTSALAAEELVERFNTPTEL